MITPEIIKALEKHGILTSVDDEEILAMIASSPQSDTRDKILKNINLSIKQKVDSFQLAAIKKEGKIMPVVILAFGKHGDSGLVMHTATTGKVETLIPLINLFIAEMGLNTTAEAIIKRYKESKNIPTSFE